MSEGHLSWRAINFSHLNSRQSHLINENMTRVFVGNSQHRRGKCVYRRHRLIKRSPASPKYKTKSPGKNLAMCSGVPRTCLVISSIWGWGPLHPLATCSLYLVAFLGTLNTYCSRGHHHSLCLVPDPVEKSNSTTEQTTSQNTDLLRYKWLNHGRILLPGSQPHGGCGEPLFPFVC